MEEGQFEKENIDKIVLEIKKSDRFSNNIKKAYYLYLMLGKTYKYRGDFKYRNHNNNDEIKEKFKIYNEKTSEKGEAVCNRINLTFYNALRELGINAEIDWIKIAGKIEHPIVQFQDETGNWYYTDLTDDLMYIQTGMKTKSFGISLEQLKEKGNRVNLIVKYLEEKQKKETNRTWACVEEEDFRELDKEFKHSYHGLYTNDIIEMLKDEFSNKQFIQEYFETTDEKQLLQRMVEFILKNIGIINKHWGNVGDVEATKYYEKIIRQIFQNEFNQRTNRNLQVF